MLSIQSSLFSNSNLVSADLEFYLPAFEFNPEKSGNGFTLSGWVSPLFSIYLIGACIAFLRFATGLVKLLSQIRSSEKFNHRGNIISVNAEFQPSSFFKFILLPEFKPEDKDNQLIISHESLHVGEDHILVPPPHENDGI
jgi:hypothetical protein